MEVVAWCEAAEVAAAVGRENDVARWGDGVGGGVVVVGVCGEGVEWWWGARGARAVAGGGGVPGVAA